MTDEFYICGTPALKFSFIEYNLDQLEALSSNIQDVLEKIEMAKRGVAALNVFQARHFNKQVVRCTSQSVATTAAARYAPDSKDLDLSGVTIVLFVDLVTYLPLPNIKNISRIPDALGKATGLWTFNQLDSRWSTYHTYLNTVNEEWAAKFFAEIQAQLFTSSASIQAQPESQSLWNQINTQQPVLDPDHVTFDLDIETSEMGDNSWPVDMEESMLVRALHAKENAWGPDHSTTLDTATSLGSLYARQGKILEAEALFLRALRGHEQAKSIESAKMQEILQCLEDLGLNRQ